jgi:membrane fusion protein, multidrug efflux system
MKTFEGDIAVVTNTEGNGHQPVSEIQIKETVVPVSTTPVTADAVASPSSTRLTVDWFLSELKERKALVGGLVAALLIVGTLIFLKGGAKPSAPANAAVPVIVQTLAEKQVRLWSEFSGRLQAVNYAEIRPEVGGRITEVRIEDGQTVKKGDVLFVIDPGPYQAALSRTEANAAFAKTELDRAAGLIKAQAIAQRLYDERMNASLVAEAELARAKIDYFRAYVKAPISGRVSRAEITVGNLVQTTPNAPLLTSIVSNNGIYADFEVDEQTYLQTIRDHASARDQERAIPVELTVQGDKERSYKGSIYSFDNRLDNVSGTIRARAKFANEDGALMPGMFVSVKIGSSGDRAVLLVPERAVGVDQNKKFVYVVGKDNKVGYREVTLGQQAQGDRIVLSGLQAGDRVIVDGTQHVRPDVVVEPKEVASSQPLPAEQLASR